MKLVYFLLVNVFVCEFLAFGVCSVPVVSVFELYC